MTRSADEPSAATAAAEQQILALYRAQNRAMLEADVAGLDAILDDGFVAVHIGGYRQPKGEWLAQIRSGEMTYHAVHEQDAAVTVSGDSAVLDARAIVDATIHGAHAEWPLRSRTTFELRAGTWRAVRSQATVSS
ncbi:nuclear transport factor 2 family protein [Microbacterium sp. LMI12-1-1.1]|uniref:nuclear transport factor 2 family protein n=1 Tax=Microbacterium sp. LMI12-1-1.1 TaxID=3135225 RepID=UPI00341D29BC